MYIPGMEHWHERARRRLTDLGLTQEDLCRPLGVRTSGAVGHYLSGRRQPTPAQLTALASTLRCSLDWLMMGIGAEEADHPEPVLGAILTPDEQTLLERYRQMAEPESAVLLAVAEALAARSRQRKRK